MAFCVFSLTPKYIYHPLVCVYILQKVLRHGLSQEEEPESNDDTSNGSELDAASTDDAVDEERPSATEGNDHANNDTNDNHEKINNDDDNESANGSLCSVDRMMCSICLEPYKSGDLVSWSIKEECNHVFHYRCIYPWLLKSEQCPVCRSKYLVDSECNKDSSSSNSTSRCKKKKPKKDPAPTEVEPKKGESVRSHYQFSAHRGLFLPKIEDSLLTLDLAPTKSSSVDSDNAAATDDDDDDVVNGENICYCMNENKSITNVPIKIASASSLSKESLADSCCIDVIDDSDLEVVEHDDDDDDDDESSDRIHKCDE